MAATVAQRKIHRSEVEDISRWRWMEKGEGRGGGFFFLVGETEKDRDRVGARTGMG